MSEANPPPQTLQDDSKVSSKQKWRGKLLSIEGKIGRLRSNSDGSDDDVAKFLNTAITQPRVSNQSSEPTPSHPSIAYQASPTGGGLGPPDSVDVYRRAKPRQNKGLRVAFEPAAPQIIGEGGDEAELPSKEVSTSVASRTSSKVVTPSAPLLVHKEPQTNTNISSSKVAEADVERRTSPLPRRPTGLGDVFQDTPPTSQPKKEIIEASSARKPVPYSADPSSHSQRLDELLNAEVLRPGGDSLRPIDSSSRDKGRVSDNERDRLAGDQVTETRSSPSSRTRRTPSPTVLTETIQDFMSPDASTHLSPRAQLPLHEKQDVGRDVSVERKSVKESMPQDARARTGRIESGQSTKPTLRSIAKDIASDALEEFESCVQRFYGIFHLGISAYPASAGLSFMRWILIAAWWFVEGRSVLEGEVRKHTDNEPLMEPSPILKQAYVNLAKALWIVKEITPNHPEIKRFGKASMSSLHAVVSSLGDQALAELVEVHVSIVSNMRALAISMKRNGRLPPPDFEAQRLRLHVILENATLPGEISSLLTNNLTKSRHKEAEKGNTSFFPIPIGDTARHFHFGRMFVGLSYLTPNDRTSQCHIPCIISILRDRSDWGVKIAIASQDDQVNLVISDASHNGLPWRSVQWKINTHEMVIRRSEELTVIAKLTEKDFKVIWGICDYTKVVRKSFFERTNEKLVFERALKVFKCDSDSSFPPDALAGCTLRVYEKQSGVSDGSGLDKRHDGYRVAVITPTNARTLRSLSHDCGREHPILFGVQQGAEGFTLVVKLLPSFSAWSIVFVAQNDIELFRHILSGTSIDKSESQTASIHLRSLVITATSGNQRSDSENSSPGTGFFPWKRLRLITSALTEDHPKRQSQVPQRYLRILADSEFGTLTDRCSLEPGDLQVGLSVDKLTEMRISRLPQSDMTWSLADGKVRQEDFKTICRILNEMFVSRTVRSYEFRSLAELHCFQAIVTGFTVLFDGVVSTFAISRRRTVVPVHKRWEATSPRLQIIKQDKTVQLVAFFRDFSHGTCMNFGLRMTDEFEIFSKSGLFFIRIVDAKFALPKGEEHESSGFLNFDTPEYPSEHDDIIVGFDDENGMALELERFTR